MAKFSDETRRAKKLATAMRLCTSHTLCPVKLSMALRLIPAKMPNRSKADTVNMSVGNISKDAGNKPTKTSGIKVRGTGAATKGLMARGPMA
jgi:hypothetical protein